MKTSHALGSILAILACCSTAAFAKPTGVALMNSSAAIRDRLPARTTGSNPWYHGGYLIGEPEIHAVFWGSSVRFAPQLSQFYADMGNSAFFNLVQEYELGGFTFGRAGMPSGYVWDEAPVANYLTDADIESALTNLLNAGTISATPNALFMLHFPPGVSIEMGGGTSCNVWCAYHGRFWWNNTMIYYGVVPDHSGGCEYGCGGGTQVPDAFSRTCVSTSHEVIESMTDPEGTGWFNGDGYEISDLCNGQPVALGRWWVQKQWSNRSNGCVGP